MGCFIFADENVSNFDLSIASYTFLAEMSETSCSAERPPKRMPMRFFMFVGQCDKTNSRAGLIGATSLERAFARARKSHSI